MENLFLDEQSRLERAKMKAFLHWMTEELGINEWKYRKNKLISDIKKIESSIDLKAPIEPQLFQPPENDIDWHILSADLAWDHPQSDSCYSTRRIYPYIMAIGGFADVLRDVPNIKSVVKKMLDNNNSPETQLFEILTAAHYIKNGYEVEFVPENSNLRSDGSRKSPDLKIKMDKEYFFVECKRADKQTKYSSNEEMHWKLLWTSLSELMLSVTPWTRVDITFKTPIVNTSSEDLKGSYLCCVENGLKNFESEDLIIRIENVDSARVKNHYQINSVRPNTPQQELLIFGDMNSNEARDIATLARSLIWAGDESDILNIFVEEVANCAAAQWRCQHEESLDRRSRHFKSLIADAISQIPPDHPGVVHILYETTEGIDVEKQRREKHLKELQNFDASNSKVIAVLIHGVNYYPSEENYEWAETLQDFCRVPDFVETMYADPLMLGDMSTTRYEPTTHWQQDEKNIVD